MAAADDMKEAAMASVDWQNVEITAQRSCAAEAFPQGTIDSRPQGFIPSQSYFRIELEVLGQGAYAAAAQPLFSEQIALATNCAGNLFTNAYFQAGILASCTSFSRRLRC